MKQLWLHINIWWYSLRCKRKVKRSIKKYPKAYRPQGWEWEDK